MITEELHFAKSGILQAKHDAVWGVVCLLRISQPVAVDSGQFPANFKVMMVSKK